MYHDVGWLIIFQFDVVVNVIDVPERPCCLTIDEKTNIQVPRTLPIGSVLGSLAIEDDDFDDKHLYQLTGINQLTDYMV